MAESPPVPMGLMRVKEPSGTMRYLGELKPRRAQMRVSRKAVRPSAALISFHSTGCAGRRPRRRPLTVPKGPRCQMKTASLQVVR